MRMLRDHPVAGVGLANWELVYPRYAQGEQFRPGFAFLRPHNDYIWIATELGVAGLGLHLWLLGAAVCLACRHAVRSRRRLMALTLLAAALGLVAISGHAFFSFPRERPTPTALTWAWVGLIAGLVQASAIPSRPGPRRAAYIAPAVLLAVLSALAGVHIFRGYRADAAYFKGLAARAEGHWETAARHLDRAASIGVFDYRYLLQKSQVAQHMGRAGEALAASLSCLDYHPNSISAWYNVGQLRSSLGDYGGARDALARTVSLDPDNGVAFGKLGLVYRRLGMPDSARYAYEKALALAPDDAIVNYNAAGFHREVGEVTRARDLYERCVALDSSFVPAYRGLAEALGQLGDYGPAADTYRRAIRLDPAPPEAHYGLGLMLERLGDRNGAIKAYLGFLERWRGDSKVARKVRGYVRQLGQGLE
jgi:tetratricopeptide (TPR) repeat protein